MQDADTMSLQYYPERERERESARAREREREREAPPYYDVVNPHPQRDRETERHRERDREIEAQQHSPQSYTFQSPETHQAYTHASSSTSQNHTLSPRSYPFQPPQTHQDPAHRHLLQPLHYQNPFYSTHSVNPPTQQTTTHHPQSTHSITPTILGRGANALSKGSTRELVGSTHEFVPWLLHSAPQRSALPQSASFQPPLYCNGCV